MTARMAGQPDIVTLDTPVGPARVHFTRPLRGPFGVLVLGHGAGPSLTTVDLTTTVATAAAEGWLVALVEQPWLVAGKKVATRPAALDVAWIAVIDALRGVDTSPAGDALSGRDLPLLVAGRSAGARVACRTALTVGAVAVLAVSFPLHPPGRPEATRLDELLTPVAAGLPVHSVQGERDPFGTAAQLAAAAPGLASRYAVPGTHTIPRSSAEAVATAVREVLRGIRE